MNVEGFVEGDVEGIQVLVSHASSSYVLGSTASKRKKYVYVP